MTLRQRKQTGPGGRGAARRRPGRGWTIPLAAFFAFAVPAGASSAAEPAEPMEFFPADQIRPGLEGVARTVFQGDEVEEFRVEFLGVLKSAIGPQQDMILARLHGETVEFT
ncbi:MAG TPA: SpoIVB peptidase S55, partial [Candidatus Polarisedimenticolia bacterium]|nr:SpoIVB peptidase S55 [Candidatus Polarisedimenticolia bacterium]